MTAGGPLPKTKGMARTPTPPPAQLGKAEGRPSPAAPGRKGQVLLSAPWWSRKLLHLPISQGQAGKSHPGGAGPLRGALPVPAPQHRSTTAPGRCLWNILY